MRAAAVGAACAAAVLASVVAVTAAARLIPPGTVTYVGVPAVVVPLSPRGTGPDVAATSPAPRRMAMLTAPEPDLGAGPPEQPHPALLEASAAGTVPRIAADGRTALDAYARPSSPDCSRPCVAVLITGLGLVDKLTARAMTLPGVVGLAFSPYDDATAWQVEARRGGHETFLVLPLQPERFPVDDAGPLAIRAAAPPEQQLATLLQVLAAGSGYPAVVGEAGAFALQPASFAPVAAALAGRGVGLVELGGGALADPARASALTYVRATATIDGDPSPAAIDRALADVAAEALRSGRALAVARPLPASFDRLAAWLATLPEIGLRLVPPTRLLQEASPQTAAKH